MPPVSDANDEPGPGDTSSKISHRGGRHETLQLLQGGSSLRSVADAAAMADNPGVIADFFGASDVGKVRSVNEDHFLVAALERSLFIEGSNMPAEAGTRVIGTPQGRLLIVADGMGGHGAGDVASAVAVDAMARYAFEAMPWVLEARDSAEELRVGLQRAVSRAQSRLRRVAERKSIDLRLGTTLTLAYLTWPDLHVVHVGDSRAYLYRQGTLHRITKDHTLAQQLVDGDALTPDEAARSRLSHVLVNAVGGGTDELEVELHRVRLELEDQLLLCTDGLYDMVSDELICQRLSDPVAPVHQVVDGLIRSANDAGGRDNVTIVLARF